MIENDVDFPPLYFHNNLKYSASVSRTETGQEIKLKFSKHFDQSDYNSHCKGLLWNINITSIIEIENENLLAWFNWFNL